MTTLTNSQGKILNYTNELTETIPLQLNSMIITQLGMTILYSLK